MAVVTSAHPSGVADPEGEAAADGDRDGVRDGEAEAEGEGDADGFF
jgi:hypothetical protein